MVFCVVKPLESTKLLFLDTWTANTLFITTATTINVTDCIKIPKLLIILSKTNTCQTDGRRSADTFRSARGSNQLQGEELSSGASELESIT